MRDQFTSRSLDPTPHIARLIRLYTQHTPPYASNMVLRVEAFDRLLDACLAPDFGRGRLKMYAAQLYQAATYGADLHASTAEIYGIYASDESTYHDPILQFHSHRCGIHVRARDEVLKICAVLGITLSAQHLNMPYAANDRMAQPA